MESLLFNLCMNLYFTIKSNQFLEGEAELTLYTDGAGNSQGAGYGFAPKHLTAQICGKS